MTLATRVRKVPRTPARGLDRRAWWTAVAGLVLLVLGLLLYRDFVFGNSTLLYKDIGSDSINVFYPSFVLRSEYLRRIGLFSWSFQVGMGQNIFPSLGSLLLTPVIWLPKGAIAGALVYQHLFYVVVGGLCFGRFLANRGLAPGASLLGALLFSFSAYMCMGSCWYFHAYEAVCFAFLLFAVEETLQRGRWAYLTLGVAVVGLLGAFHLYLCALFLCLYVPIRLTDRFPAQPRQVLRISLLLAGAAFLGLGLVAIVALGNFYGLLNSPRGSGPTSLAGGLISSSPFRLESSLHYITAILRPFGNDLLGTGSHFHGWQNYLEAPLTYCGLVALVLLPQAFVKTSRRHRLLCALLISFLVIPTVFPWFRHLFWAFQGDYYRAYSLFSVFGVITLAMVALSRYGEERVLNLSLLALTSIVLVGTLYLPVDALQRVIDDSLRQRAAMFIVAYTVLLVAGSLLRKQRQVCWIIIALSAGELCFFDQITVVDDRPVVTRQELNERIGYNDETVDVIRDLKATDQSFYRVTKTFLSGPGMYGSVNDALVFGFYGTSSYSSFNNLNYTNFLMAVDVIDREIISTDTKWSLGLLGHPLLSTFAGEKYVLTEDPVPYQTGEGYELMRKYGPRYLFRNQLSLPLGLSFEDYLSEKEFLSLESEAKAAALLQAVVLSDEVIRRVEGLTRLDASEMKERLRGTAMGDVVAQRRRSAWVLRKFSESRMEGTISLEKRSILLVQTAFDPGWRAWQDGRRQPVVKVDFGLLGVPLEAGAHEVELRYVPVFSQVGGAISFAALILFVLAACRWPRLRLDHNQEGASNIAST